MAVVIGYPPSGLTFYPGNQLRTNVRGTSWLASPLRLKAAPCRSDPETVQCGVGRAGSRARGSRCATQRALCGDRAANAFTLLIAPAAATPYGVANLLEENARPWTNRSN